jgi:hypothetical protein
MDWVVTSLRENPARRLPDARDRVSIGRVRLFGFSLGNVVGTLLGGVLVGSRSGAR